MPVSRPSSTDADATGDALHTLLLEAGDDPVAVAALLSAPRRRAAVDQLPRPAARARRGPRPSLGHLRGGRDVDPSRPGPARPTTTSLDCSRPWATGDDGAAGVRARVMAELARTSSFAQQEPSTITLHEGNSAGLESAAVDWVLDMPESIDATLAAPAAGAAEAWSIPVGASHQPRLSLEELTGLIGAFAVEGGRPRAAGTAAGLQDLARTGHLRGPTSASIEGELDRAAQRSAARDGASSGLDDVATRIGYFEQAASAALVDGGPTSRCRQPVDVAHPRRGQGPRGLLARAVPRRWVSRSPPWPPAAPTAARRTTSSSRSCAPTPSSSRPGATSDALRRSRLGSMTCAPELAPTSPRRHCSPPGPGRGPSLPTSERWPLPADRSGSTPCERHLATAGAAVTGAGTCSASA